MKKFLTYVFLLLSLLLVPDVVFAQATTFRDLSGVLVQFIKGIISILFASLGVGLLYGVVLYFMNADNEKKRQEIKGYLLWGVIGIIVVFGMWGLIQILCDTLSWCTAGIPIITPPA